jgi:hypothetical protein
MLYIEENPVVGISGKRVRLKKGKPYVMMKILPMLPPGNLKVWIKNGIYIKNL